MLRKNKIISAAILFSLIFACYISEAVSEDVVLESSVDKTKVAEGERFVLAITISGNYNKTPQIKMPELKDFVVVAQNQYSNYTVRAKKVQANTKYNFILICEKEGKFTVGPAELNYQGKTYKTQPIEITVSPSKNKAIPAPKAPNNNAKGAIL